MSQQTVTKIESEIPLWEKPKFDIFCSKFLFQEEKSKIASDKNPPAPDLPTGDETLWQTLTNLVSALKMQQNSQLWFTRALILLAPDKNAGEYKYSWGVNRPLNVFVFSQVASVIFPASYPPAHICKFQIAIFWRYSDPNYCSEKSMDIWGFIRITKMWRIMDLLEE